MATEDELDLVPNDILARQKMSEIFHPDTFTDPTSLLTQIYEAKIIIPRIPDVSLPQIMIREGYEMQASAILREEEDQPYYVADLRGLLYNDGRYRVTIHIWKKAPTKRYLFLVNGGNGELVSEITWKNQGNHDASLEITKYRNDQHPTGQENAPQYALQYTPLEK